jgi:hypothetical protein
MKDQRGSYRQVQAAARELQTAIQSKYPAATFRLSRAADEQRSWNLWTMVDIDDLDEVSDLVTERALDMRVEEGIPIHVVPIRGSKSLTGELSPGVKRTG